MTRQSFHVIHDDLRGRLDPHYYLPEFRDIEQRLRAPGWPVKEMGEIATIACGSTPREGSFIEKIEDAVVFLKTVNVQDYYLDLSTLYFISRESHAKRRISEVKEGDILLTIIGANLDVVGRVVIVPSGFMEANINQNIAAIRVKDPDELDPYFVMAFLGLEPAQRQIARLSRQAGQVNLNIREVGLIQVPLSPPNIQTAIIDIIRTACRKKSQKLEKIEQLLRNLNNIVMDKLGLKLDKIEGSNTFVLTYEEIEGRLDAEFYKPKFRKLEENLQKKGTELGKLVDFQTEKVNPRKIPEEIFRYVEIENLDEKSGMIKSCQKMRGEEAPSRARLILREGDLVIPSLSGTFKKVSVVTKEYDGAVGTTGLILVKPTKVNTDFLFAVLRSDIGQLQLERNVTGAIMPSLTKTSVRKIMIPLDRSVEESIGHLAAEYRRKIQTISREAETILIQAKLEAQEKLVGKL